MRNSLHARGNTDKSFPESKGTVINITLKVWHPDSPGFHLLQSGQANPRCCGENGWSSWNFHRRWTRIHRQGTPSQLWPLYTLNRKLEERCIQIKLAGFPFWICISGLGLECQLAAWYIHNAEEGPLIKFTLFYTIFMKKGHNKF